MPQLLTALSLFYESSSCDVSAPSSAFCTAIDFTFSDDPNKLVFGWISVDEGTIQNYYQFYFGNGDFSRFGTFTDNYNVATLTVSQIGAVAGAVPEPQAWAMFIAGFGIVGAVARRRRTAGATTAA